jgi:hypothetical protein
MSVVLLSDTGPAVFLHRRVSLFSGLYWPVQSRMMAIANVATATITIHLRYLWAVSFLTSLPRRLGQKQDEQRIV